MTFESLLRLQGPDRSNSVSVRVSSRRHPVSGIPGKCMSCSESVVQIEICSMILCLYITMNTLLVGALRLGYRLGFAFRGPC
jgi:hypothetical protein